MPAPRLPLSDVLSIDVDLAGIACYRLLARPLGARVGAVARRLGVCHCRAERRCDTCQDAIDTLIGSALDRVRGAAAGNIPRTKAGETVREWVTIVAFLTSPEADEVDADDGAELLLRVARRQAGPDMPAWARAMWAQLVHYPCRHLDENLPRRLAADRGMIVRPERLAGGLDVDDVARVAVGEFLIGARDQVADPYAVPATRKRYALSEREAADALHRGLGALMRQRPDAYLRTLSVVRYSPDPAPRPRSGPPADPETDHLRGSGPPASRETGYDEVEAELDAAGARAALAAELRAELAGVAGVAGYRRRPGPGATAATRRRRGRPGPVARTLRVLVEAGHGRTVDVVAACRSRLNAEADTETDVVRPEVERLAKLVSVAGITWTETLLTDVLADVPGRSAAGRP